MNTATRLSDVHTAILKKADMLARLNTGIMAGRNEASDAVYESLARRGWLEIRADGCYWITARGRAALEGEDGS